MNKLKIWNNFTELKECGKFEIKEFFGYVYFVEYGKFLKIGSTRNPIERLRTLSSNARLYHDVVLGKIYITPMHTNFEKNEIILHNFFRDERKDNSELFDITIDEAVKSIYNIPLLFSLQMPETAKKAENFIGMVTSNLRQSLEERITMSTTEFDCIRNIIFKLCLEVIIANKELGYMSEITDELFNKINSIDNAKLQITEHELLTIEELLDPNFYK